jgi:site-specific DNA-methyltransferase (adenine-specific)
MELNTIHHGDYLEKMKLIADKSIDMILCDLPYGTTNCKWDVIIPFEPLWKEYLRIIKDNGAILLTAQQPFATDLINSCRKYFRYEIIWEKTQKLGFLNANKMPLRGHENILVFYKKLPTYNPQKYTTTKDKMSWGRTRNTQGQRYVGYANYKDSSYTDTGERHPHSVIKISNWNGALFGKTDRAVKHPTQKPVELFSWLIKTYTNPGETVLDNCSGSATTAIACIQEGRNYICIEKDETYYQYSLERVQKELLKTA